MSYNIIARVAHASMRSVDQLTRITSNIANINTPGYKAGKISFVRKNSVGPMENEAFSHKMVRTVDYSPGVIQKTGNVLDLAIHGDGFFVIETEDGDAYTKNGNFSINRNGELVTQSGDYVMGESGRIVIDGEDVHISNRGIVEVDGNRVGKLRIVNFEDRTSLVRIGGSLFKDPGTAGLMEEENLELSSGYLELSNVRAVKEMIEMINVQRSFEAYQKVMLTIGEQDKLAINRIGNL